MRSFIALIFVATVSLATPAAAIDEKGNWTPYGARSCGQWLEYREKDDGNSWERVVLEAWFVGFINGANRYHPGKANYLEGTDMQSATLWIDKYCNENPLSDAADAANALIEELARRP